ncbi:ubiquitin fusion degradation protein 1 [Babesia caballi]|uniref:Ubiquitin fusion degradation protein 1 n=1 Tax=Babesia caballi TaxID=5871 RepID=A0AAV4LU17_BABCB|nr:ubiquitin fusion degradation protein 1 [Babesia caballi]
MADDRACAPHLAEFYGCLGRSDRDLSQCGRELGALRQCSEGDKGENYCVPELTRLLRCTGYVLSRGTVYAPTSVTCREPLHPSALPRSFIRREPDSTGCAKEFIAFRECHRPGGAEILIKNNMYKISREHLHKYNVTGEVVCPASAPRRDGNAIRAALSKLRAACGFKNFEEDFTPKRLHHDPVAVVLLHNLERVAEGARVQPTSHPVRVELEPLGNLDEQLNVNSALLGHLDVLRTPARHVAVQPRRVAPTHVPLNLRLDGVAQYLDEHVVVALEEHAVPRVLARQLGGNRVALGGDVRLEQRRNGHVHVGRVDVVGEAHLGVGLGDADDRLDVPQRQRVPAAVGRLLPDGAVEAGELALNHAVELGRYGRRAVGLGVPQVLGELHLREWHAGGGGADLALEALHHVVVVGDVLDPRVQQLVVRDDVLAEQQVLVGVGHVLHDDDEVEPAQDGVGEVHVLLEGQRRLVAAEDGVGRGDDRAPGLERRHYPGLGDGDRLLLHGLVDRDAVLVGHLVELVDAADAHVGEHQGSALQRPLAAGRVAPQPRGETHRGGALSGGEHASRRRFVHIGQELRLAQPGVAHEEDVDVTPDAVRGGRRRRRVWLCGGRRARCGCCRGHRRAIALLRRGTLADAPEERAAYGRLGSLLPEDRRRHRGDQPLADARVLGQVFDVLHVLRRQVLLDALVRLHLHRDGLQLRLEHGEAVLDVQRDVVPALVDGQRLDHVARTARVHEVAREDDDALPRRPPRVHRLGRLLDGNLLVVVIHRVDAVNREGACVAVAALLREDRLLLVAEEYRQVHPAVADAALQVEHPHLRQHHPAAHDDAADFDQRVEFTTPQVAQLRREGPVNQCHLAVPSSVQPLALPVRLDVDAVVEHRHDAEGVELQPRYQVLAVERHEVRHRDPQYAGVVLYHLFDPLQVVVLGVAFVQLEPV